MACDICGKKGTTLSDLLDAYKTDDIKSICPACEKIVNRKSSSLLTFVLKMRTDLLRRFMQQMKSTQEH
jgi:hypothetical protein